MTDLEAIEVLQGRARSLARGFHVLTGFATLGLTLVVWWAAVMLQWQSAGVAEVKISFGFSLLVCVAVVPAVFRRVIKLVLAQKRPEWIEELVRTEGARRDVLESSFTLDSW